MSYSDDVMRSLTYAIQELNNKLVSLKSTSNKPTNASYQSQFDINVLKDLERDLQYNNLLKYIELQLQLGMISKEDAINTLKDLKDSINPKSNHKFF